MKVMPVWMKTTEQTKPFDYCCHIRLLSNTHQTKPLADGCHSGHLSGATVCCKFVPDGLNSFWSQETKVTVRNCWVPSIFFDYTRSTAVFPSVQQCRHQFIPVVATLTFSLLVLGYFQWNTFCQCFQPGLIPTALGTSVLSWPWPLCDAWGTLWSL